MGKVDDMRAMREARYSARAKRIESLLEKVTRPESKSQERRLDIQEEAVTEELCGHQSISKARCTRPKDHPEKNHRYK